MESENKLNESLQYHEVNLLHYLFHSLLNEIGNTIKIDNSRTKETNF